MVWDRHTKGPAKYRGHLVVNLSEDRAREIKDVLTKQYIAER
jgi:outer membrane protein OmpA-like peptidoglycan-associated protein